MHVVRAQRAVVAGKAHLARRHWYPDLPAASSLNMYMSSGLESSKRCLSQTESFCCANKRERGAREHTVEGLGWGQTTCADGDDHWHDMRGSPMPPCAAVLTTVTEEKEASYRVRYWVGE